jgi:hypothetical protein
MLTATSPYRRDRASGVELDWDYIRAHEVERIVRQ